MFFFYPREGNTMKTTEVAWSLALLVTVILICSIIYACYRFVETTIASVPCEVFVALGIVCCASLGLVVSGGSLFIVRWMSYRSRHIFAKGGLYPHVYDGRSFINLNEPGAQTMVAFSACKPNASVAARVFESLKDVGKEDPALIPGPAAEVQQPLLASEVMAFNPKTSPHWLLVGSSGSGKTSASYQILSQFSRLHGCEFVIAEPRAVNWGDQAKATTTADIAGLIIDMQSEMERRQDMLRQHDVDHISQLPGAPPYKVLVMEETDSVFDDLKLTDRELRTAAIIALRSIARMGRKAGVCLVAVTTSGTTDVFDANVRKNLSNVLLFRSEHTVAESWRIGTKLSGLKPGTAYSLSHQDFIKFDITERPQLVIKTSRETVQPDVSVESVVPVSCGSELVVPRLPRGCEPDEQLAEQLRHLYHSGRSKTSICNELWGYKDGVVFGILNRILGSEDQSVGHLA
jgi:hypothetical protein